MRDNDEDGEFRPPFEEAWLGRNGKQLEEDVRYITPSPSRKTAHTKSSTE